MSVARLNVQFDWQVFIVALTSTSSGREKNMEDQYAANKRGGMLEITPNNSEQYIDQIAEKHEQLICCIWGKKWFNDADCSSIFKGS